MRDTEIEEDLVDIFRKEDRGPFWLYNKIRRKNKENGDSNEYRYVSKTNRYVVLNRQHWCCNMCGCRLKYSSNSAFPGEVAHIDHVVPFSERDSYNGDINEPENLQALCPNCNLSKGKKKIH